MLYDKADTEANISIKLETNLAEYEILLGFSAGRINLLAGETLDSKEDNTRLIERRVGSDKADFYHTKLGQHATVTLREPEKLAFTRYLDLEETLHPAASELESLLRSAKLYYLREADLYELERFGSEASYQTALWDRCRNLWSVLRNIHDRRSVDNRYDTIIDFMRKSFPRFEDLWIEQTGPNAVYGHFIERGRRHPIQASGVSDGHLQMLAQLTALFSEGEERASLLLFDEPEVSLHPHALSVFAEAVQLATEEWNKQVFIATHSPVLISQFEPQNILAMETNELGETVMTRVSEMDHIKDLLEQYATGSLYMAEIIAAQSRAEYLMEEKGDE